MAAIELKEVSKVFPGGTLAVDDVTLSVADGEFIVLVGPSGCGKSTLLRMIAGLEEVTEGSISIGERDVTRLAPRDRDIAMVFQNYALYPHMSVRQNLGYALKVHHVAGDERDRRVLEVARMLGLGALLDRRPAALSGGQRQRVAMGRAIIREPAAFLMDEPLSNLDAKLRVAMRAELARLHERLKVTTVYVTHDQVEAMTLGQRVAVMREGGRVQQVDTPQRLYDAPVNLFVAAFIGSPSMNLVQGTFTGDAIEFGSHRIPLDPARRPAMSPGSTVIVGVRPEDLDDEALSSRSLPVLDVTVAVTEELGSSTHLIFPVDAPRVDIADVAEAATASEEATLLAEDTRVLFTAVVQPATKARPGSSLRLTVDPARMHFFDPATGHNALRLGEVASAAG